MKTLKTLLACLVLTGLMLSAQAQQPEENVNMFKLGDAKQTADDFEPAPAKIYTDFGTLNFEGGAFPDDASVQKIYDQLDLQRATQAYHGLLSGLVNLWHCKISGSAILIIVLPQIMR